MDNTYIILYKYSFNKQFMEFKTKYLIIALLKFISLRCMSYNEIKLNFKQWSLFDNEEKE
ncbi:hypothetical protein [Gallibacterium sp. ZY190522]